MNTSGTLFIFNITIKPGASQGSYNISPAESLLTDNTTPEPKTIPHTASNATVHIPNTTPPLAVITAPEEGSFVRGIVSINGTASDANFKNYTVVWSNETTRGLISTSTTPVTEGVLATWDTTALADDNYTLILEVYDIYGNRNASAVNITLDNTPPSVGVSPMPASVKINDSVNITVKVSDAHLNTSSILLSVEQPGGFTEFFTNLTPESNMSYFNTSLFGRYNVSLTVSDVAGNINTTNTWFVTVAAHSQSVNTTAGNVTVVEAGDVNARVELMASNSTSGTVNLTMSRALPPGVNTSFALPTFGKYYAVNASSGLKSNISWLMLKFYYTQDELDASSLDESSLRIAWYDESNETWVTLSPGSPGWVHDAGVNTTDAGGYAGFVWANISHLSSFALVGHHPTPPPSSPASPGGGGGSGGGGGASAEAYENILVKERYYEHIYAGRTTSYAFKASGNPVVFVNITGNVSAGETMVMVEVLQNTSTLVDTPPPGLVYQNVNIWVGSSGFATPRNIRKAVVVFKVSKAWMEEHNVASVVLLRYSNATWVELDTRKIGESEGDVFYESVTDRFSPFAIAGG